MADVATENIQGTVTPAAPAPATSESIQSLSSDAIKEALLSAPKAEEKKPDAVAPEVKPGVKPEESAKVDPAKQEEWFDKEHGFKTKEDAIKSYTAAQDKIRQMAEEKKQFDEREQKLSLMNEQINKNLEKLSQIEKERNLSPEERQKQQYLEQWRNENKDAIDFLKNELKNDLLQEQARKSAETRIVDEALSERKKWMEDFEKDESRKQLYPIMDEIFKNEFRTANKNPLPFIEALAFKKHFPTIAEQIKKQAVDDYKKSLRAAEEAEKGKHTEVPGGAKVPAGDVDVSKMSSAELKALLPTRDED